VSFLSPAASNSADDITAFREHLAGDSADATAAAITIAREYIVIGSNRLCLTTLASKI
jgi:hypothetical protein